jgi:Flp pilus assembly protein TadD
LKYYEGELYRQRGQPGDLKRALSAYREAVGSVGTPAEVHRELGLTYLKIGDVNSACTELGQYLEMQPNAIDRTVIGQMLKSCAR